MSWRLSAGEPGPVTVLSTAGSASGFTLRRPSRPCAVARRSSSEPLWSLVKSWRTSPSMEALSVPALSHFAASGRALPLAPLARSLPSAAESSGVIGGASLRDLPRVSRMLSLSGSALAGLVARKATSFAAIALSFFSPMAAASCATSGASGAGSALSSAAAMHAAGLREAAPTAADF